jgi:hypothetical protein
MRAWVYKINRRSTGGHCDNFLRYRGRRPFEMGGRDWIRSPQSWACLRRVRRGDLFVCHQTDERRIYGLGRAFAAGYESLPGSGRFDSVDFCARGLRLEHPVDVRQPLFRFVRAFTTPSQGTIHSLAADEWRALLSLLIAANQEQKREILAFVGRHRGHR